MHAVLTSQIADILHFNYKMINKKVSVPPTHKKLHFSLFLLLCDAIIHVKI